MSERRTETTVNVYAGVPFNNKYKDVLFVSRDTLASYLSQFEIGTLFQPSTEQFAQQPHKPYCK